jgi:anti-sigma regulatory factor (Ser/Thr protein kinase)
VSEVIKERFPAAPEVPGHARALVRQLGLPDTTRSTVELIVSELVTNAVVHGDAGRGDPVLVALCAEGDCVRGRVCSQGTDFEWGGGGKDLLEPGGLGLQLVDSVTTDWGIERNGCQCVWFECDECS